MAYVPRQRNYKIRWKIAVPLLLLVVLIIYAIVGMLFPSSEEEKEQKFTVCGLNSEDTIHLLNKAESKNVFTVKDYLYYGESLGFYTETYDPMNKEDELAGKTVELHNLCTDETIPMTMDSTADQKITLQDLGPGFYEVTVIDNLISKRVVYDKVLTSEPFTTAKRNGTVNSVQILADKDLLKDYGISWNQNYVFLNIEESKANKDDIDVLIDPYSLHTDLTYTPDEGNTGNGIKEYKETYQAALWMKDELEKYGLRVEITKSKEDEVPPPAYGENGRLAQGYKKNARYYLFLRFNTNIDDSIKGVEIWHSNYSSATLGKHIMYGLEKNLNMKGSPYTNPNNPGVSASPLMESGYDLYANIRESGGRASLAGRASETSQKENKSFANANGMLALEIDFGYVTNKEDAAFWKSHKEEIARQAAASFASGINVNKE